VAGAPVEGIRFERTGRLGVAVLDRQQALNALSRDMIRALSLKLLDWREDPDVAAVLIKAAPGRAFCAGGDVRFIYDAGTGGRVGEAVGFYREEYRLNWRIFRYPKPYIALIDGIVMGGGVGVSVHGSHRVVGGNVTFAMPETGIGFFPDVGGTYFLPHCPGEVGTWLGLTGARLGAADCLHAGLATQHVPAERHAALEDALSTLPAGVGAEEVDATIAAFATRAGEAPVAALQPAIDACFAGGSLPAIVARLEGEPSGFGAQALEQLRQKSPLSLHVTLRQLRSGGSCLTFEEAMQLEFRLANRFMRGSDFYEGVRALLVDKDRRPRWRHPRIGAVPAQEVDAYFDSLDDDELTFDWEGL
jgi:enoyl-CoA hydratase